MQNRAYFPFFLCILFSASALSMKYETFQQVGRLLDSAFSTSDIPKTYMYDQ